MNIDVDARQFKTKDLTDVLRDRSLTVIEESDTSVLSSIVHEIEYRRSAGWDYKQDLDDLLYILKTILC